MRFRLHGFGVKGRTPSLIHTAIEITQGRIGAADIDRILAEGRAVPEHPVERLPGARGAVEVPQAHHRFRAIASLGELRGALDRIG